jgi:hypothetical protein
MTARSPDDAAILARWEPLGRLPIPIAFNERKPARGSLD